MPVVPWVRLVRLAFQSRGNPFPLLLCSCLSECVCSFFWIFWSPLLVVLKPDFALVSVSVVPTVALVGCTVVPSAGSSGRLCWLYWSQSLLEWVCLSSLWSPWLYCGSFFWILWACFYARSSECIFSYFCSLVPASFNLFRCPVHVCPVFVLSCTVYVGVGVRFPRLVSVLVYCPILLWLVLDFKPGSIAPPYWGPAIHYKHKKTYLTREALWHVFLCSLIFRRFFMAFVSQVPCVFSILVSSFATNIMSFAGFTASHLVAAIQYRLVKFTMLLVAKAEEIAWALLLQVPLKEIETVQQDPGKGN